MSGRLRIKTMKGTVKAYKDFLKRNIFEDLVTVEDNVTELIV